MEGADLRNRPELPPRRPGGGPLHDDAVDTSHDSGQRDPRPGRNCRVRRGRLQRENGDAEPRRAEAERQEEERRRKQEEDWARAKRAIVENMKRDIKACVSVVRQWTDTKFHKGFSSFDAYATGEYAEHISFFGTAEERFQFQKCMAERGNPLSDPKAEKKEN